MISSGRGILPRFQTFLACESSDSSQLKCGISFHFIIGCFFNSMWYESLLLPVLLRYFLQFNFPTLSLLSGDSNNAHGIKSISRGSKTESDPGFPAERTEQNFAPSYTYNAPSFHPFLTQLWLSVIRTLLPCGHMICFSREKASSLFLHKSVRNVYSRAFIFKKSGKSHCSMWKNLSFFALVFLVLSVEVVCWKILRSKKAFMTRFRGLGD